MKLMVDKGDDRDNGATVQRFNANFAKASLAKECNVN
jgi:hypothetical protein